MRHRVRITKAVIDKAKAGEKYQEATCLDLVLNCQKNGKTWYFLKKWKYKQYMKCIGSTETVTRDSAIAKCVEYCHNLQQYDRLEPLGKAADPKAVKLSEVIDLYGKVSKEVYAQKLRHHVTGWLDRCVSDITHAEVQDLYNVIAKIKPVAANRTISYLRAAINLARREGMLSCENPAAAIRRSVTETPRQRYLSREEVRKLMTWLNARRNDERSRMGAEAILMRLYTWQRSSNVMQMEWREIDRETMTWIIPAVKAKAGRDIVVPLPEQAIEIIRGREKKGKKYIFEMPDGKPLQSSKKLWNTACRELGIADCHLHDLRHTGATYALRSGADITTVSAALGHASVSFTAKVYAHVMTEAKLEAARGAIAEMMKGGEES